MLFTFCHSCCNTKWQWELNCLWSHHLSTAMAESGKVERASSTQHFLCCYLFCMGQKQAQRGPTTVSSPAVLSAAQCRSIHLFQKVHCDGHDNRSQHHPSSVYFFVSTFDCSKKHIRTFEANAHDHIWLFLFHIILSHRRLKKVSYRKMITMDNKIQQITGILRQGRTLNTHTVTFPKYYLWKMRLYTQYVHLPWWVGLCHSGYCVQTTHRHT